MAEVDPNQISCRQGGRQHMVREPRWWTRKLACEHCGIVYVRDKTWAQGWRPEQMEAISSTLVRAEHVVRQQRDPGDTACCLWEPANQAEARLLFQLARLQATVMAEPFQRHPLGVVSRPADRATVIEGAANALLDGAVGSPDPMHPRAPAELWRVLVGALGRTTTT